MKSPIIRTSTLILFFGAIGFFVACKAGYFDGKPAKDRMSSSKSGAVISPNVPDSITIADKENERLKVMSSSKSGIIFDQKDLVADSVPSLRADTLTIDAVKAGKFARPQAKEIQRLELELNQERTFISSSKVMIIEHKRLDQLIDSLTFMRKLDSLFKVLDQQKKKSKE